MWFVDDEWIDVDDMETNESPFQKTGVFSHKCFSLKPTEIDVDSKKNVAMASK